MKSPSFRWRTLKEQDLPSDLPVIVALRDTEGTEWFQVAYESSGYLFECSGQCGTLRWDEVVAWAPIPPLPKPTEDRTE